MPEKIYISVKVKLRKFKAMLERGNEIVDLKNVESSTATLTTGNITTGEVATCNVSDLNAIDSAVIPLDQPGSNASGSFFVSSSDYLCVYINGAWKSGAVV